MRGGCDVGQARILLVEKDVDVCAIWAEVFNLLEFEHRAYTSGAGLLAEIDRLRTTDLLITNYYLPDCTGVELVERVRRALPQLQVIVLTGSREDHVLSAIRRLDNCGLLQKPFSLEDLEAAISDILKTKTRK